MLVDYLEARLHLNAFRSEYGIWWGFGASTRDEIKDLVTEFEDLAGFTPDQIERLLQHWKAHSPNWRLFLSEAGSDDLGLYQVGLPLTSSPTSMNVSLQTWMHRSRDHHELVLEEIAIVSERLGEVFHSLELSP